MTATKKRSRTATAGPQVEDITISAVPYMAGDTPRRPFGARVAVEVSYRDEPLGQRLQAAETAGREAAEAVFGKARAAAEAGPAGQRVRDLAAEVSGIESQLTAGDAAIVRQRAEIAELSAKGDPAADQRRQLDAATADAGRLRAFLNERRQALQAAEGELRQAARHAEADAFKSIQLAAGQRQNATKARVAALLADEAVEIVQVEATIQRLVGLWDRSSILNPEPPTPAASPATAPVDDGTVNFRMLGGGDLTPAEYDSFRAQEDAIMNGGDDDLDTPDELYPETENDPAAIATPHGREKVIVSDLACPPA